MASCGYTNRNIVDLVKDKGISFCSKTVACELQISCTYKTLQKDISRVYERYKSLAKSKSKAKGKENLDKFLDERYAVPNCNDQKTNKRSDTDSLFLSGDSKHLESETYKHVAMEMAKELAVAIDEKEKMEVELETVIDEKDDLNESVEKVAEEIFEQKKKCKRTINRESYWRETCMRLENKDADDNTIKELEINISELNTELKLKQEYLDDMQATIEELKEENYKLKTIENIEVYDEQSKTYIMELHQCVYTILEHNVAHENVSKVIDSVLKLVNKQANKLPSASTIQNWSVERAMLARKQISEQCQKENTTLHSDEASKYGTKWGAFATRDTEGNYTVLGLRDMATKSSADTLETFKEILSDFDNITEETEAGKQLLSNIKNTMSDRASTETKFNQLLSEYRETILPEIVENYDQMNIESKQAISTMNNFFCGLHTLVHMADVCGKCIYETETTHFDGDIPIENPHFKKAGQSGTLRLIHTACKAFARRGDQKNGCHGGFSTFIRPFLKENKLLSLPLQPLKGNRFNILFTNAGHIYFLKDKLLEFLEKSNGTNGLLRSVLKDLQTPFFLAGCKALGLISKLITTPLWRVIENKDVSISTMNHKYLQLLTYLNDAAHNLQQFICGQLVLFEDVPVKEDVVYKKLVSPSELDAHVVVLLSVALPALAKLIQRQYVDHLPGGKHEHLNPQETLSVDKHNKFPERVFSFVDHILSAKPNIKTLALEAHITFTLNKTSEWLAGRDDASELIRQSRAEVKSERGRFKARENLIMAKRNEKQAEEFLKKEELEQKRIQKLENETNDMMYYGLWQTKEQVNIELAKMKTKREQEEALKVQLRFRKNVFKQAGGDAYIFSKQVDGKRVCLSIEELKSNVIKLIGDSYKSPPPEQSHLLVGKTISHRYIEDGADVWYTGCVISQVPGFPQWFNVQYDGDEAIYSAKLAEEYEAGDVKIVM